MSTPKILFIVFKNRGYNENGNAPVGVLYSTMFLENSASKFGATAKTVVVESANEIPALVDAYNPTHVSIQALVIDGKDMAALCRQYPDVIWNVRIHSKIPFLATDEFGFRYINDYMNEVVPFVENFQIASNNKATCKSLSAILDIEVAYLPNIYLPESMHDITACHKDKDVIDVGCFGALRVLKNQLNEAVAVLRYAKDEDKVIRFHINEVDSDSQEQKTVLQNLLYLFDTQKKHQIYQHPWTSHKDFIETVKTMDLGLQVSLSETYNFVAADFVSSGVPVIVSPEVEWMPSSFQADPSDVEDIMKTVTIAMRGKFMHYQNICQKALFKENDLSIEWWDGYINGY